MHRTYLYWQMTLCRKFHILHPPMFLFPGSVTCGPVAVSFLTGHWRRSRQKSATRWAIFHLFLPEVCLFNLFSATQWSANCSFYFFNSSNRFVIFPSTKPLPRWPRCLVVILPLQFSPCSCLVNKQHCYRCRKKHLQSDIDVVPDGQSVASIN